MMLIMVGLLLLLLGMQDSGMHCQHYLLDSCQLLLQHPHSLSLLRHLLTAHAKDNRCKGAALAHWSCCCTVATVLRMPAYIISAELRAPYSIITANYCTQDIDGRLLYIGSRFA